MSKDASVFSAKRMRALEPTPLSTYDNTLNFAQAKVLTSGNPWSRKRLSPIRNLRLSRLDRTYNRNMVAVAHTKRGEHATAAAGDVPLIPATAARTIDTTADAFNTTIDGKSLDKRGDAAEALPAWVGKHRHRLMNLYCYDELGTIGGHELRARLIPARDLDLATVEERIEGVPRATTQIARRSLPSADLLGEPFKHADTLKAVQTDSARTNQLMADDAKPEEPARLEPPPTLTPGWKRCCGS
ncbi:hypothetical protein ACFRJ8_19040 [Arthrobacter sp. NPDC056886]|uniref:hypothetical protein n=1 Tax=Arthrobacter sp. NPDC056886 TaxID=3345960 RepID=UPI00366B7930